MNFFTPSAFQGSLRKKRYFEGWYIKTAALESGKTLALIPGISLGKDSHAFLQIIDGREHKTGYLRFPLESFQYNRKSFDITLGNNTFSTGGVFLNESRKETSLKGELHFSGTVPFPVTPGSPGIMGPYRYAPFLECYHGVVSADHRAEGRIEWDGVIYDFQNARGYIEKDWGKSMPSAWIWMHCNLFPTEKTSFMLSIARVPWLGRTMTGHLGFLYTKGKYHRFGTYLKSRVILQQKDAGVMALLIEAKDFSLEVRAELNGTGGNLQAPREGDMNRTIRERVDTPVTLKMRGPDGELLFKESGTQGGLEMAGDISGLFDDPTP